MRYGVRSQVTLLAICLSAGDALIASVSRADTVTWANAVNGNWNDPTKWTPHAPSSFCRSA